MEKFIEILSIWKEKNWVLWDLILIRIQYFPIITKRECFGFKNWNKNENFLNRENSSKNGSSN